MKLRKTPLSTLDFFEALFSGLISLVFFFLYSYFIKDESIIESLVSAAFFSLFITLLHVYFPVNIPEKYLEKGRAEKAKLAKQGKRGLVITKTGFYWLPLRKNSTKVS